MQPRGSIFHYRFFGGVQFKMGCSLFFSWIWPKKIFFSKLVYGMILQLLWSIWVGWLIPYPLASPRYSPFFKWSPISAVNLRNLNFGFRTDKSEKNLIFHNFMWNYLKNMAFDHKTNFEILSPKPAEAIFQDFRGTQSRGVAMRIW